MVVGFRKSFGDWIRLHLLQPYIVSAHLGSGRLVNEQGIDNAFEELYAFEDQVMAGFWYDNSFVYTNSDWRLNFWLNGEVCYYVQ